MDIMVCILGFMGTMFAVMIICLAILIWSRDNFDDLF